MFKKYGALLKKHGWKLGGFVVAWELLEHFGFTTLFLMMGCPKLAVAAGVWAVLPGSEFLLYPVVFALLARRG